MSSKKLLEISFWLLHFLFLYGNWEVTPVSGLTTAVNAGKMDSPIKMWSLKVESLVLKKDLAASVIFWLSLLPWQQLDLSGFYRENSLSQSFHHLVLEQRSNSFQLFLSV